MPQYNTNRAPKSRAQEVRRLAMGDAAGIQADRALVHPDAPPHADGRGGEMGFGFQNFQLFWPAEVKNVTRKARKTGKDYSRDSIWN